MYPDAQQLSAEGGGRRRGGRGGGGWGEEIGRSEEAVERRVLELAEVRVGIAREIEARERAHSLVLAARGKGEEVWVDVRGGRGSAGSGVKGTGDEDGDEDGGCVGVGSDARGEAAGSKIEKTYKGPLFAGMRQVWDQGLRG